MLIVRCANVPAPADKSMVYGVPLVQVATTVPVAVEAVVLKGLTVPKATSVADTEHAAFTVAVTLKLLEVESADADVGISISVATVSEAANASLD